MTIFLKVNTQKEHATKIALEAAEILIDNGVKVLTDCEFAPVGSMGHIEVLPIKLCLTQCDIIITVGGDGTILQIAKLCEGYERPILGINVGRLGFLAAIEANELYKLQKIVDEKYVVDKRCMLKVIDENNTIKNALNDVVIGKTSVSQTIDVKIYCDDTLVNDYRGDGVIISTPTGSTAYSLSAGGPLLDAKVAGFVVTPLCAHSMHSPPMVFSAERSLRVEVFGNKDLSFMYSCDGHDETQIKSGDYINISLSERYMQLISLSDTEQFEAIDKKLKGR